MPKFKHDNIADALKHYPAEGVIVSTSSEDLADVTINGSEYNDVPLFYHCNPDAVLRSNGALEGASAAFSEGDAVIVMMSGSHPVRVVGFLDGDLRECGTTRLYVVVHYWPRFSAPLDFQMGLVVWDLTRNKPASFWDAESDTPKEFVFSSGSKSPGDILTYNDFLEWRMGHGSVSKSSLFSLIRTGPFECDPSMEPEDSADENKCTLRLTIEGISDPSPYSGEQLYYRQQVYRSLARFDASPSPNDVIDTCQENYLDRQYENGFILETANATAYRLVWFIRYEEHIKEFQETSRRLNNIDKETNPSSWIYYWADNASVDYRNEREIVVCNVPDIFSDVVIDPNEYAVNHIMASDMSDVTAAWFGWGASSVFTTKDCPFVDYGDMYENINCAGCAFGRLDVEGDYDTDYRNDIYDPFLLAWYDRNHTHMQDYIRIKQGYYQRLLVQMYNRWPNGNIPWLATTTDGVNYTPFAEDEPEEEFTWEDKILYTGYFGEGFIFSVLVVKDVPGQPIAVYANSDSGEGAEDTDFMDIPERPAFEEMIRNLIAHGQSNDGYFQCYFVEIEYPYAPPA